MNTRISSLFAAIFLCALFTASAFAQPATRPALVAKWIWAPQDCKAYNQTIVARKTFTLAKPVSGQMRITADSFYRLSINGQWVNDGPCRAWPEHYQYDVLDVSSYLRDGENQIEIVARYFGVGDFHRVPQQAGLLAQLDVILADKTLTTLITDASWDTADALAWQRNTPKISIQMEPFELYDARRAGNPKFAKAKELFAVDGGPWKDLNPRDVALLTRQPVAFRAYGGAKLVKADGWNFCLPAVRLMHPGLVEANHNASAPCGMASILETEKGCTLNIQLEGMKLSIDGKPLGKGEVKLAPGKHMILAFVRSVVGHDKEKAVRFMNPVDFNLKNPLDSAQANPWCFIPLPDYKFATDDLIHGWFNKENPAVAGPVEKYQAETERLLREIKTPADFTALLAPKSKVLPADEMFVEDCFWQFTNRSVAGNADGNVVDPTALMHDTPAVTTILPGKGGDVELMYDLGEQNCGYWTFDMVAPAGVIVDIFAVEYIAPDGRIQFSWSNRNGLRYITREGVNRFTSLKRRSGRHIFVTLRNATGPVRIRHIGLIESTYPLNYVGSFSCSDARLDKIWEISTRTLKLCMEDTFTDCPLYEQTHWVGDARNEALMAYPVFGATDIGRRCIRITAQSLDRYPFAGCQTPSGWDVMIPAWSFLWGISTWDYYWYTGDKDFLREVYPDVIRNLKGAEKYVNKQDLFAGPFWNFFDWTRIDQEHHAVLHNSMLMIGAIDAAIKEAAVIGDTTHIEWLKALRARMVAAVNKLWDAQKNAYPDSVHNDGKISDSTSQHTAFLSVLYDIVDPANLPAAKKNMVEPSEKTIKMGAPFAALYLYEALEKIGMEDRIVEEIYRNFLPMLEAGATTVWESFPSGITGSGGFPTRSHTHAWSSAPSYFLNRIVLGVKPTAPGAATVQISPRLGNLTWANGKVATARGTIEVSWRLKDARTLEITCAAPDTVKIDFVRNSTHAGKDVIFNGKKVE